MTPVGIVFARNVQFSPAECVNSSLREYCHSIRTCFFIPSSFSSDKVTKALYSGSGSVLIQVLTARATFFAPYLL